MPELWCVSLHQGRNLSVGQKLSKCGKGNHRQHRSVIFARPATWKSDHYLEKRAAQALHQQSKAHQPNWWNFLIQQNNMSNTNKYTTLVTFMNIKRMFIWQKWKNTLRMSFSTCTYGSQTELEAAQHHYDCRYPLVYTREWQQRGVGWGS